jgi:hypothetical protein
VTPPPHRPLSVLAPPAVRRRAHRRAALRAEAWLGPGSPGWRARLAAERRAERRTFALLAAVAVALSAGGAIAWGIASDGPMRTADRPPSVAAPAR